MDGSIERRERVFDAMLAFYRSTLRVALRHPGTVAMSLLATVGLNYYMFRYHMNYGLFPVQDTGLIVGSIQADQSISFQEMKTKLTQLQTIVQEDPAVASVVGFTGGRPDQLRLRLHVAEAVCRTKSHRRRGRDAAARQARRSRGRAALHGRRFRPENRRSAEQRDLSIYAPLRRHCDALCMGSQADRRR